MERARVRLPLRRVLTAVGALGALAVTLSCRFDPSYRDVVQAVGPECESEGSVECRGDVLTRCEAGKIVTVDDCRSKSLACAPTLLRCTPCRPGEATCDGLDVVRCDAAGQRRDFVETCKADKGIACRLGVCTQLCDEAAKAQSNVGCEYWAVDLDNAVTAQGNAAAQQFAVVVSNPQPDLVAHVTVTEDTGAPGGPASERVVATATVRPRNLEVFKLGPKEVDGSPEGTYDTGPGTALSRGGYKVVSDVPIVAYQFNPLENANVFSNDASQLLPVSALGQTSSYVIAGWPQTIARSEQPNQNFGTDLRAFLTICATRPNTQVRVRSTARVVPGGPAPQGVPIGGTLDVVLQPYEVLNLETGSFNADFTGSLVTASAPVAVFVGSEASDAPFFGSLAERQCCADHLEDQAVPVRAVGKRYVLGHVPNRSKAVKNAGGPIGVVDEPEYYRVVAVGSGKTTVTTSLPPPYDKLELADVGASRTITALGDFTLEATQSVIVVDVQASQEAAGVPRGLPGGDPSLTYVAPVEQWRSDYVFLTPDKYAFDFVVITAPFAAKVYLDSLELSDKVCEIAPGDGLTPDARKAPNPAYLVYRCQLSFPAIDPAVAPPNNVTLGRQNDGVHRVQADFPVGVLVYGFDSFVSYAYAGGTDLREINVR